MSVMSSVDICQLIIIAFSFIFLLNRYWNELTTSVDNYNISVSVPGHQVDIQSTSRKQRWKKGKPLKDSDSESELDISNDPDYVSDDNHEDDSSSDDLHEDNQCTIQ
jgi:hypothetical protein